MNAPLDQNSQEGMIALLNTNGTTITAIQANPSNHSLEINDAHTGSNNGGATAALDENGRFAMYAESSANNGAFVALYVDSTGHLLIDSS